MRHFRTTMIRLGVIAAAATLIAGCGSDDADSGAGGTGGAAPDDGADASITFSYSAAVPQTEKVPLHLALEKLDGDGTPTTESYHQSGEDAIQAVARGESDFGTANAATVLAATAKGVPVKAIMTAYYPGYVMAAPVSVSDPGGLDGMRVGIHAKVSSTTLYTNMAMADYPDAKPDILVVPGSANRVQALIAGQLDASIIQYTDWLTLQEKAPDKYHLIYNVAKQNPEIIDSMIFTSTETLSSRPDYVKDFLAAVQQEYGTVGDDAEALGDAIADTVPGISADDAQDLAESLIDDELWPADGGFSEDKITATLDALESSGLLSGDELPTVDQCCTAEFLASGS